MEKAKEKTAKTAQKISRSATLRIVIIGIFTLAAVAFYVVRMASLQLTSDGFYYDESGKRINVYERTVTVAAQRGEIRDRQGKTLVKNGIVYQTVLEHATFPTDDAEANALLATLITVFDQNEEEMTGTRLPITAGYADGRYVFYYPESIDRQSDERFTAYLDTLGLSHDVSANELLSAMYSRYHLYESTDGTEGALLYAPYMAYRIASIRYDLEAYGFENLRTYTLCENTGVSTITPIKERALRGVTFSAVSTRVYPYAGYASHILGRTGPIQQGLAGYYTEQGYPLDAIVGIDGIELAYESVLRGTDGEMVIKVDSDGNVLSQEVTKPAVAGKNVYLTINIDLQIKAEDSLKDNIDYIVENALSLGAAQSGEDANAGALVVVDPHSGQIYASASYPTYDLSTFSEDYESLLQNEADPLVNRPLLGTYAPGSTFKVGVAAAALEDGLITPETKIKTEGIYSFYEDYQPRCWVYTRYNIDHGEITVTDALRDSCNYFFFDIGRRLGITKIADYATTLGLGQKTGVELPETAGILSSPDYTDKQNITWTGAATLQTAIGQGYNALTPMQLASYFSTVANGGTRYACSYVLGVTEPHVTTVPTSSPTVLGHAALSAETHETLVNAMIEVAENGSATRIFRGYGIEVAAKTGTAEGEESTSPNAVFAAFAPAKDPELVCVSVIENGASGTAAGFCIRDVFDTWFGS